MNQDRTKQRLRHPSDVTEYRRGLSREKLHRLQSQEDISSLGHNFPRVISLAKTLLQQYGKFRKEKNTAGTIFCFEQARIVSGCYLNHMKKNCNCSYDDICDLMLNLVALHCRMRRRYPETAQPVAASIRKLFVILEEIDQIIRLSIDTEALEELDNSGALRNIRSWKQVGDRLVVISPNVEHRHTLYIPKISDFQFVRILGVGGFATVFLVKYKPANLLCVLRAASTRLLSRNFAYCDKTVASVTRSPHLPAIYTSFETKHAFVSIMEYTKSVDIAYMIHANWHIGDPRLVRIIAVQCVRAIEHMHLNGIIHRDIKPPNMLITAQGYVKIIDMDLPRVCIGHFLRRPMPVYFRNAYCEMNDTHRCGTLLFHAPELLRRGNYGRSIDWWALGVSLFEIAFGYHPYKGTTVREQHKLIFRGPLELPRTNEFPTYYVYSADFVDFLAGLLDKDHKHRLGTASYAEIHAHPYMANLDDLLREGFNAKIILKCLNHEPFFSEETLPVRFEDIQDLPDIRRHFPLFTYCTSSFRRLMDKIQSGNSGAVLELTPPSTGLNYEQPFVARRSLPPEIKLFDSSLLTDTVVVDQPPLSAGMYWDSGFRCHQAKDDLGRLFLMVTDIAPGSPASNSDLICHDLIATWNGNLVNGNELPQRCHTSAITLEVRYCNAFRLFRKCKNVYSRLVPHFRTLVTIAIELLDADLNGSEAYGFKTTPVKAWSSGDNDYKVVNLVNFVDPVIRDRYGLYEGDIVCDLRPGGKFFDAEYLSEALKTIGQVASIAIRIAPLSVLRTNNRMLSSFMEDVVVSDRERRLNDIFSAVYYSA